MEKPRPETRRWMTWALVASAGLNLALIGLAVGVILRGPPPGAVSGPALAHYARALPLPYQHDLRHALRSSRGEWAGQRAALRAQRGALADALVADPFDAEAVRAIFEREDALSDDLAARGARLLMEQIERMPERDRAAYAAALRENWRER
jgi:uncharacterized membrane protein